MHARYLADDNVLVHHRRARAHAALAAFVDHHFSRVRIATVVEDFSGCRLERQAFGGADEPLLEYMGFDPVDVDSLCARAGLPAEKVSAELLRLELAGRVAVLPGGMYQRLN